jgi:putative N6-adenine-specific DNA methylase
MPTLDLIATAAFGLEAAVAYELKKLGYEDQKTEQGRVLFKGDWSAIARANTWLRTSDRVLLRMGEFAAGTFDTLFDEVRALPWAEMLPQDAFIHVLEAKSVKSQLTNSPAIQSIVKKSIVEAMLARYGGTRLPETGHRFKVMVSLNQDVCTIALDTSGDGLHKRGYRELTATAPLKETLAAGLISLARWFPDRPFADPLCGSGTIPIEAAMIGLNIAPGLNRRFDAEYWPMIDAKVWRDARREALDLRQLKNELQIQASDISGEVLVLANHHARLAGVAEHVRFERLPVSEFRTRADYGTIITNPPYGERLGEEREVEQLYREMGEAFTRNDTWGVYVLTSNERFDFFYGQRAEKKRKLYNGKIRCDLYQYPGPRPPRPPKAPSAE